jgi:hypothetical protein
VTVTSAQRKLARGVEQVKALQAEAEAFGRSEAYIFDTKRERRAPNEIFCRCYATERVAPPDHWPMLAGEAIQNLRSALDHAVWQAWKNVQTNTGDGDHTQFVICDSPGDLSKSSWHLKGVPAPVRTVIKEAQPYKRWPQDPSHEFLAVLRDLSNMDKHRTLTVIGANVTFEMLGAAGEYEVEGWDYASGKRLGKGTTEISSFLVRRTDGELDEMSVQPSFTYGVRIEWVGIDYLKGMVHDIFVILTEIETGAKPHPFAPYPL